MIFFHCIGIGQRDVMVQILHIVVLLNARKGALCWVKFQTVNIASLGSSLFSHTLHLATHECAKSVTVNASSSFLAAFIEQAPACCNFN